MFSGESVTERACTSHRRRDNSPQRYSQRKQHHLHILKAIFEDNKSTKLMLDCSKTSVSFISSNECGRIQSGSQPVKQTLWPCEPKYGIFSQEGFLFGSLEEELYARPRSKTGYSGVLKKTSFSVDRSQNKVRVQPKATVYTVNPSCLPWQDSSLLHSPRYLHCYTV